MAKSGANRGEAYRAAAPYLNLGWTFLAAILVWGGLGWLADRWLGTEPLLLTVGCVVGIVAGFVHLVLVVKKGS
jgi:F0F1-type ATP synthase assembly protein I